MIPETADHIVLTVLGETQFTCAAQLTERRGRQARLSLEGSLPAPCLVQIEGDDWAALGEVVQCQPSSPATATVELAHLLYNTKELARRGEVWLR